VDHAAFLRQLQMFRSLTPEELTRLAADVVERSYEPGTAIVRRDEPGDSMFIVREGAVQVPVVDETGQTRLTAFLGPGDFFGEMALLTGEPRAADVIADGEIPVRCLQLPKDAVEALLFDKPRVARFLTEIVGRRLLESGGIRRVGKYQILGEIGRGGVAIVFEGLHPTLRRSVAIKMLSHELVFEQDFADKFQTEARIVADLRHENIVQVFDQESAFATFFIVMELMDGIELSRLIDEEGPLSPDEVRHIVRQCCRGLAYAHARGVVHRDIKPTNIFLESTGRTKIMDFGIAVATAGETRDEEGVMGTPGYIAPEALLGEGVDLRADIYALGVSVFEMLTGRGPFDHAERYQILQNQLACEHVDLKEAWPEAPEVFVELVRRATTRDRAERFQSCVEMLELLDERQAPRAEEGHAHLEAHVHFPPASRDRVRAALDELKGDLEELPGVTVVLPEPE
jgi:CRP-like cAMP-binding protein